MTQQELREGSFADMLMRIASERQSPAPPEVVLATQTAGDRGGGARRWRPRPTGRLFPDAPRRP